MESTSSTRPTASPIGVAVRGLVVLRVGVLACLLVLAWGCTVYVRAPLAIVQLVLAGLSLLAVLCWPRITTPAEAFPRTTSPSRDSAKTILARLGATFSAFAKTPYRSAAALLPLLYLLPLLWSEVPGFTLRQVQLVLPALLLPFAGFVFDDLLLRWRARLWLFFVLAAALMGAACAAYALVNAPALTVGLGQGQAVPTPLAHVRFATALAFAGILGLTLASGLVSSGFGESLPKPVSERVQGDLSAKLRWLAGLLALVSIIAVHIIAVRTGLVLLYLGIGVLAFRLLTRRWSGWLVSLVLLGATLSGAAAAWQLPAVQQRLAYMRYDLERVDDPAAAQYSDAARLLSYRAAWSIIVERPFTGARGANFREEMASRYAALGHPDAHLLPTNQYLFSWCLAGIGGLVGLLAALCGPMLERRWWRRPMLAETLVMLAALCLVETPLSSDVGLVLAFWMIVLAQVGALPGRREEW